MKKIYLLGVTLVSLLFFGCTNNKIEAVQDTKSLKKSLLKDSDINKSNLSNSILLLGDTQEHEDFGIPVLSGTNFIDTFVTDVTRRTAQANLNELEIVKSILKQNRDKPLIHMGDFMDISCHTEFTRAIDVLSQHNKWIIMLGNHDGYYVGNFLKQEASNSWAKECDSGRFNESLEIDIKSNDFDNALKDEIDKYNNSKKVQHVRSYNKSTVIERYLSTLFRKNREVNSSLTADEYSKIFDSNHSFIDVNISLDNLTYISIKSKKENEIEGDRRERTIEYTNNQEGSFIKKIHAYVNQCKIKSDLENCNPQRSFLLQKVSLKKNVELILLDTSVYEESYSNGLLSSIYYRNSLAGNKGNLTSNGNSITEKQTEIVKRWIDENNKKNITTIFAGHHPLSKVKDLQDFFDKLPKNKPIFYISAHTHQGFWRKHKDKNSNVTELNIGSLIDSPVHYRTLQVEELDNSKINVVSELKEIKLSTVKELTGDVCKFDWLDYSLYPYADPSWQENENKSEKNIWNSEHLKLLPYLSYYLKLLETEGLQYEMNVSFYIIEDKNNAKKRDIKTRKELIAYLKRSIETLKKKLNDKEEKIDSNKDNSCIYYINNKLSSRDCSNLLYRLKKDEDKIFKNFNQKLLSTYKVCTALNAIDVDAKTSKAKVKHKKEDLDSKAYKNCNTLHDCQLFEFENRKIEKFLITDN